MPELDIRRRKYTYGRKRKKKKEKFIVSLASGLLPWAGDSLSDIIRKIVFLVAIAALAISAFIIVNFYFGEKEEGTSAEDWSKNINHDSTERISIKINGGATTNAGANSEEKEVQILEKYLELYERNNDFVGYISISPYIDYPVAQTTDNQFYLDHNFDKVPTLNGTIFADYECVFDENGRSPNTIIGGHNLITRNGFQPLSNYRGNQRINGFDFLKDNPVIKFDTLYEEGKYKIFSVFLTNTKTYHGEVFDYWNRVNFETQEDFFDYVTECLDRSYYNTGVDLEYGDELLTLNTCDFSALNDLRLVVVARRVRDGEDPTVNTDAFINNKGVNEDGLLKYKSFDGYYNSGNGGRGWAGRSWDVSQVKGLAEYLKNKGV